MNIQSVNALSLAPNMQRSTASDNAVSSAKGDAISTAVAAGYPPQSDVSAKPTDEQLKHVVKTANDLVSPFNDTLQFSIDKDTGTTVVKVIDTSTKEVIKQIPSEDMLALAKALDQLKGLLVKQKA